MIEAGGPRADDLEVLRVVFGEHQALRKRLDAIDACLAAVAIGNGQAFVEARAQFEALLVAFLGHLQHEEVLLIPILAHLQAWGPVRLEELRGEHAEQRQAVGELVALDPETTAAHWAARMSEFSAQLRQEMAGEEHDFLHPNAVFTRAPISESTRPT